MRRTARLTRRARWLWQRLSAGIRIAALLAEHAYPLVLVASGGAVLTFWGRAAMMLGVVGVVAGALVLLARLLYPRLDPPVEQPAGAEDAPEVTVPAVAPCELKPQTTTATAAPQMIPSTVRAPSATGSGVVPRPRTSTEDLAAAGRAAATLRAPALRDAHVMPPGAPVHPTPADPADSRPASRAGF